LRHGVWVFRREALGAATDEHYCLGIELLHVCVPFDLVLESAVKKCAVKTIRAYAEAIGPDLVLVQVLGIEVALKAAADPGTSKAMDIAEGGFRATELLRRH
jgi:hypothetical protein